MNTGSNPTQIVATVASGAGFGLLGLLGLTATSHGAASTPDFAYAAVFTGLALIALGSINSLLASSGQGHFSRQNLIAMAACLVGLVFCGFWSGFVAAPEFIVPIAIMLIALCALAMASTSSAQLFSMNAIAYALLALASGSALLAAISTIFGRFQAGAGPIIASMTALFVFAAMVLKLVQWRKLHRNEKESGQSQDRSSGLACLGLLNIGFFASVFATTWVWLTFLAAAAVLLAFWIERRLALAQS